MLWVKFNGEMYSLVFNRYMEDNSVAIQLLTNEGLPGGTATVCLPEWKTREGHVWIKDHSENTGMADALVQAGVIELTGASVQQGFVSFPEAKLLIQPEVK
jgi:hypothetical protein